MSSQQGFDNSVAKGFPASILFDNPLDSLMPRDTDDLKKLVGKHTEAYIRVNFMGEGASSPGGSVGTAASKGIRRRKKTYTSTTADQTLNLDTVTGVVGGKVKSFSVDLVQQSDANKVAILTNGEGDVDVLNGLQRGAFLQGLELGEYVSDIGSLVLEGTESAGQNIVHLTWSEEL